jgi:hypothetical protein
MMDPIAHIDRLGWDWHPDGAGLGLGPGVVLSVAINGRVLRAFVPLSHIWLAFHEELEKVGCCVGDAWVGEPFSVGGFFSFVKKATRSLGSAASSVVPKAIQDAASNVYSTAQHFGEQALHQVSKVPVLGTVVTAANSLATLPTQAVSQLIQGKRIDHLALDQFRTALGSVKAIAPYAQTVVSFVPGIGQGISAGLGGALALAQGQSINEAMLTAIKDAIPGGPAAQAAFAVASGALEGKPIDQIALNALPIDPEAKKALALGLSTAKAVASGQNVSQVAIDAALHQLPQEVQKAVQVGVAVGHAKNLQDAATAAAHGAQQLVGHYAAGQAAAQQFVRGVRSPEVLAAMQKAHLAHAAAAAIVQHAQAGHPQAKNIVNAMRILKMPSPHPQAVDDIVKALGRVGPSAFGAHHQFA